MRGENGRPAPFFIGHALKILFRPVGGAFSAVLCFESLEIHKVFLRLPILPCRKSLAPVPKNTFCGYALIF